MRVRYTATARREFNETVDYLLEHAPLVAAAFADSLEQAIAELLDNPTMLLRAGWPKGRSNEALKPGTRVKLYIGTSRAGGFDGIVLKLENEKGENIVGNRGETQAVDMDGVPGGLQPSADVKQ